MIWIVGGLLLTGLGLFLQKFWRSIGIFLITNDRSDRQTPMFGTPSRLCVRSTDGRRIEAVVIRPDNDKPSRGVVILCHAWGLSKERTFVQAQWIVEQGFTAVCFDFRNCGDSQKVRKYFPEPLDHGVEDLEAVHKYVTNELSEASSGISLMGLSYGGNVALAHAGFARPEYRAIILDSTPLVTYKHFALVNLKRQMTQGSSSPFQSIFAVWTASLMTWLMNGGKFYQLAIDSCAQMSRIPILCIFGEKENFFSTDDAQLFAENYFRGNYSILNAPKGRHLTNHISAKDIYWDAIDQILTETHGRNEERGYYRASSGKNHIATTLFGSSKECD